MLPVLPFFKRIYALALLACALFVPSGLFAQLQAGFTADKTIGCSPLTINFNNNSTGLASDATYLWDFGNGNSSTLKNPTAIFLQPQSYTVILKVSQGGQTSIKSMKVEVSQQPTADFSVNITKGCLPLAVQFTGQAQPGSGTIASYYWDFGDGSTIQTGNAITNHTYNTAQSATVSLTVKNSIGCNTTVVKKDIIKISPSLSADFSADKLVLCNVGEAVQLANLSKGTGALSYLWEFGDGNTSTDPNPSRTFDNKGTYAVKLTVNSPDGCTSVKNRPAYVNVANYSTDLKIPTPVCLSANTSLQATCSPTPNRMDWNIDGIDYNNYWSPQFSTAFNVAGPHTVKFTATYGSCQQAIVKTFTVEQLPNLNGFLTDNQTICGPPFQVTLKDTSTDAVKREWDFDYYNGLTSIDATTPTANATYQSNAMAALKTYNAAGCSKQVFQQLQLSSAWAAIQANGPNGAIDYSGCGPVTFHFSAIGSDTIAQYLWFFDNQPVSTAPEVDYTFSAVGAHSVRLEFATTKGCKGVAYRGNITILSKPSVDFASTSGTTICGNTPVSFQSNNTNSYVFQYYYVNGQYVGSSYYNVFQYQFTEKGKYTIKMVSDLSGCRDTVTKVDYIEVLAPFPKISEQKNSCDTREQVTFTQTSRYGEKWNWDFGDGQTTALTVDQPVITHNYSANGKYKVVLTVTNGQCSVKDSIYTFVQLKPSPLLATVNPKVCPGEPFDFTLSNLPRGIYDLVWVYYFFNKIEYSDGTPFLGNNNTWQNFVDPLPYGGQLNNIDPTKTGIRMILSESYFGCLDTTNFVPLVSNNTKAGFAVLNNKACLGTPIQFEDTTKVSSGNSILQWDWDFGDGQKLSKQQPGNVSHLYSNPGNYNVVLKVKDGSGCSISSSQFSGSTGVAGPKAGFYPSSSSAPVNTTIYFYNITSTANTSGVSYKWDFGDGTGSALYSPSHVFVNPGTYTIKLTASDPSSGCSNESVQQVTIGSWLTRTQSFIGQSSCLPMLASFNVAAGGIDSLSWDFGDGVTAGNMRSTTHIYDKPGNYQITLTAKNTSGQLLTYIDSVIIKAPDISVIADKMTGCAGTTIKWSWSATNAASYSWDFGNGSYANLTDSTINHRYDEPGTYTPAMLVVDARGCAANAGIKDKIVIYPGPTITVTPGNGIACLGQPLQLNASGAKDYLWTPVAGLSDPSIGNPVALPAQTTTYKVKGIDINGCTDSATYLLNVKEPFRMQLTPSQAEICEGKSVSLQVAGANSYNWINNTAGLNNTNAPNAIAIPLVTTVYTVVGYDAYNCFTDTANITVKVNPRPTVDAGADKEILPGEQVNFAPLTSNDVVKWVWSPSNLLSCSDCASPVANPKGETKFTVTVSTQNGCEAMDEVVVKIACSESHVRIPNIFTPNRDGKNDLFSVKGISQVEHMAIYNRWGSIIFQRNNFNPADPANSWDGTINGEPQPAGTYVYIIELNCSSGERFLKKGSFILVR